MKEIKVTFNTLTPLWTGDAWQKSDKLKLTGIIGSFRWWFEALVRGMGYKACDCTGDNKCQAEIKEPKEMANIKLCPACYLFGTTGWKGRFRVMVESEDLQKLYNGKVMVQIKGGKKWHYESGLMGSATLKFSYEDMVIGEKDGSFVKMSSAFPSILKILLYLISEYGMLGAKTSMGYGVVKFQIKNEDKNEDIQITEDDWKNFNDFMSLFKKQEMRELPNLKDMFFVKFGVNSNISEIINNIKQFYIYNYQDGIVEGNVDKWKDNGWAITSPVVRKCLRCIFRGKYSEKVCKVNRRCNRNYWWIKSQSNKKNNRKYNLSKTIDYLKLSERETKTIRHFLMGSTDEPEFSAIQVSHVYKNRDNLEFRIWGWLPDKWPIKGKVKDIFQLLSFVFNETPWDSILPSSNKGGICWKDNSLQILTNVDIIRLLFINKE